MLQSALGFESVAYGFMYNRGWRTTDGDNSVVICNRHHGRLEMEDKAAASFRNQSSVHTKNSDRDGVFVGCDDITTNMKRPIPIHQLRQSPQCHQDGPSRAARDNSHREGATVPLHLRRIRLHVLEHLIPDTDDNRVRRSITLGTFGSCGLAGKLTVFPPDTWPDAEVRAWLMGPCLLAIMGDVPGHFRAGPGPRQRYRCGRSRSCICWASGSLRTSGSASLRRAPPLGLGNLRWTAGKCWESTIGHW